MILQSYRYIWDSKSYILHIICMDDFNLLKYFSERKIRNIVMIRNFRMFIFELIVYGGNNFFLFYQTHNKDSHIENSKGQCYTVLWWFMCSFAPLKECNFFLLIFLWTMLKTYLNKSLNEPWCCMYLSSHLRAYKNKRRVAFGTLLYDVNHSITRRDKDKIG